MTGHLALFVSQSLAGERNIGRTLERLHLIEPPQLTLIQLQVALNSLQIAQQFFPVTLDDCSGLLFLLHVKAVVRGDLAGALFPITDHAVGETAINWTRTGHVLFELFFRALCRRIYFFGRRRWIALGGLLGRL